MIMLLKGLLDSSLVRKTGLLVVMLGLVFSAGYFVNDQIWTVKWLKQQKALSDANGALERERASYQEQVNQWERHSGELSLQIQDAYDRGMKDGAAETNAVLAGVDAGNQRLRERFSCPKVTTKASVPATSSIASQFDGAGQAGLSREDAKFLVRIAGEADGVVRKLTACQSQLLIDRRKE